MEFRYESMMDLDDQTLLRQFVKSGSEAAFTELVTRHSALVTRIVQSRLKDLDASRDVIQLVFCILARKARALAQHPSISGWLVKTSIFESKKYLRRETRRMIRDSTHGALQEDQPEENPFEEKDFVLMDQAIADLPEKFREPLLMRYYQELSFRIIGQRIGKSEGAAQKLVSRAVQKLRSRVAKQSTSLGSTTVLIGLLSAALKPAAQASQASQASLNISHITSTALQSSSVTTSTLILNSLHTMTMTQLKYGAAVAIAAAIPISIQWNSNRDLREQIVNLESLNQANPASSNGSSALGSSFDRSRQPATSRSTGSENITSNVQSFLQKFDAASIKGGRRSREWQEAMQSLDGLDADQLKELITAIEKTDYGSLAKRDASHAIVEQLSRVNPMEAAEYLLDTVGPNALGRTMKEWAQRDPDAAYSWLLSKQRAGELVSKGTAPGGHQSPFAQLMSGMAIAAPQKALSAWAAVPHELDSSSLQGVVESLRTEEHRATYLEQVAEIPDAKKAASASLAYAVGLGQLIPMEEVAPAIDQLGLSADARNSALVEIAAGSLSHGGETASSSASWLLENSDPANIEGNVRNLTREWAGRDLQGAAAWLDSLNQDHIRDAAVSGFVDRVSGMEPAAAFEWAGDIADPSLRQNLQKSVLEAWRNSDAASAAKAALEAGLGSPQPAPDAAPE